MIKLPGKPGIASYFSTTTTKNDAYVRSIFRPNGSKLLRLQRTGDDEGSALPKYRPINRRKDVIVSRSSRYVSHGFNGFPWLPSGAGFRPSKVGPPERLEQILVGEPSPPKKKGHTGTTGGSGCITRGLCFGLWKKGNCRMWDGKVDQHHHAPPPTENTSPTPMHPSYHMHLQGGGVYDIGNPFKSTITLPSFALWIVSSSIYSWHLIMASPPQNLGVDSPFFSTIVLFKNRPFSLGSQRFSSRMEPRSKSSLNWFVCPRRIGPTFLLRDFLAVESLMLQLVRAVCSKYVSDKGKPRCKGVTSLQNNTPKFQTRDLSNTIA